MIKTEDPDDSAERAATSTANKRAGGFDFISHRAWRFMSKGARDNPECENTAVMAELDGETMVFRIFRQRHTADKNLLVEADRWIRQVKKHCTSTDGELKATAVWTGADGGSVLVAITGRGITCREEALLAI